MKYLPLIIAFLLGGFVVSLILFMRDSPDTLFSEEINQKEFNGDQKETTESLPQSQEEIDNQKETIPSKKTPLPKEQQPPQQKQQNSMYDKGCVGTGPVTFTFLPRKLEDIELIMPMGLMIGGHVTPIDHQYYYSPNWQPELSRERLTKVYSPADGVVTEIQVMPDYFSMAKGTELGDYRLIIHHTCTFYTIYIHINELSEKLASALGNEKRIYKPITLKAGELIGRANAFDFSAHNEEVSLTGFIVPEHYAREPWKIHTVDPTDYFTPELRAQIATKNPRTVLPPGGKIDHDVDGKLIGNWFEKDTNGYQGIKQPEYWGTHLSFAPNMLDETHFFVSLGDYEGTARQFGAKGNTPHPRDVSVATGLVKYELVDVNYKIPTGEYWDRMSHAQHLTAENTNEVHGVVLVKLTSNRTLLFEVFPNKKANEINEFTTNAKVYER